MIRIYNETYFEKMRKAAEVLCQTHLALKEVIRPGLTTNDLDKFANKFIVDHKKAIPAQLGYQGFPFTLCTSVNDEICHGYPTDRPLREGDILSIDNVINLDGGLADSCWTYKIGKMSEEDQKLVDVNLEALNRAIKVALPGNRIGDIGAAIQECVEGENGFSVIRDFIGHGIGKEMHEDPQVPHYGKAGRGPRIQPGMVFTIEPMIALGDWHMKLDDNGWTARTVDGSKVSQFEHQLIIHEDGPEIITDQSLYKLTEEDLEFIKNYKF
ncbi:type I methionyl aminopeptidase [Anaerococcus degeneri]|uniref:Methionine aminopeptidase n=1 Tax=Anaerococcus degeneri TaxID=361500 RepID=A0ABS7YYE7_9FIRM|nr:type I methionyl aminopeptidase [Anaerococcus degeneri]MBP2015137.1 methionyl aminopeptidase [Anaerococcus degeneri]MCA2095397.1 type I methionyl aminopeptidase [Anaerococcus degeneri]